MSGAAASSLHFLPSPQSGIASSAGASIQSETAKVLDAYGSVQRSTGGRWTSVSIGDILKPMTQLKTGSTGAALLQLSGGHVVRIGSSTQLELKQVGTGGRFSLNVTAGQIWSHVLKSAKPVKFEVETPSAVVGVTGTIFHVEYDPSLQETTVSTEEGSVLVHDMGPARHRTSVSMGYMCRMRLPDAARAAVDPAGIDPEMQAVRQPEAMREMWRQLRRREVWIETRRRMQLDHKLHVHRQLLQLKTQLMELRGQRPK
jgi:hypothetical protein